MPGAGCTYQSEYPIFPAPIPGMRDRDRRDRRNDESKIAEMHQCIYNAYVHARRSARSFLPFLPFVVRNMVR